jgi:hypothetical protein
MTAIASTTAPHESAWTARSATASRILLGALLLFAVVNAVFPLAPQPSVPPAAQAFLGGLFSAPYFFALLKGTELLVALALIANRFVPLALVVLAPITVNIVLFHLVLAPAGAAMAVALLVLHLHAAWTRRSSFQTVLAAK